MDDYTAHAKVRISRYIHDKIFTMPPQFTYDLNVFVNTLPYLDGLTEEAGTERLDFQWK